MITSATFLYAYCDGEEFCEWRTKSYTYTEWMVEPGKTRKDLVEHLRENGWFVGRNKTLCPDCKTSSKYA